MDLIPRQAGEFLDLRPHEARKPVFQNLGHGAARARKHGGATGKRLNHDQAEGLGPIDWEYEGPGVPEKFALLIFRNLTDVLDESPIDLWRDAGIEILLHPTLFEFGSDLERDA